MILMAVDSTAIILGRIFYFSFSIISKKSESTLSNIKYYLFANSFRYVFLLIANFFNSLFYFITGSGIYLIITILFSLLIYSYKFNISVFSKEFIYNNSKVPLEISEKYF